MKFESGFIKLVVDGTSYYQGFGVKFDAKSYGISLKGFGI
jgi:hypothetical protein